MFSSAIRAAHAATNRDLRWISSTLVPRMLLDRRHADPPFIERDGNTRGFLFEGEEISFRASLGGNTNRETVEMRRLDGTDVGFRFFMAGDQSGGFKPLRHEMIGATSPDEISRLASFLSSFGEDYLTSTLSRFNYAVPGEYVEWPSREIIEPPRDVSTPSMEEVEARVDAMHREASRSSDEEMHREARWIRMEALSRTTHGRWLSRHHPEVLRTEPCRGDADPAAETDVDPSP